MALLAGQGAGTFRTAGFDRVYVGGESGPHHRPMAAGWVRDVRDRCQAEGVPFLFKQWGGRTRNAGGRVLDGRTQGEMLRAAAETDWW